MVDIPIWMIRSTGFLPPLHILSIHILFAHLNTWIAKVFASRCVSITIYVLAGKLIMEKKDLAIVLRYYIPPLSRSTSIYGELESKVFIIF